MATKPLDVSITCTQDSEVKEGEFTPIHQWTHDADRVLLVKCVNKGGVSHGGFQWPQSGEVVTPNWSRGMGGEVFLRLGPRAPWRAIE